MGIDVAIIGSGRWGRNHVNTVNQNSEYLGIEDIYVCDIDAEKLIQWEDEPLKCFTSVEELLVDHKPSFAVVATPPETHFEITQTLLKQGISVLVEKPIAANLSDAELLIQQAEESNCVLSVGVLLRFHSGIKYAKQMLEENKICDLRSIYFERHSSRSPTNGADLIDAMGIHAIDTILNLNNENEPNIISLLNAESSNSQVTECEFLLDYGPEFKAKFSIGWGFENESRIVHIIGSNGAISIDFSQPFGITTIIDNVVHKPILDFEKYPLELELTHMAKNCAGSSSAKIFPSKTGIINGLKWSTLAKKELSKYLAN